MRYLIVGSSGYIGSYLKSHLSKLGVEYLESSRSIKAKESNDLFYCDIDLEQYDDLRKLNDYQGIIFLAWPKLDRTERDSEAHFEFRMKAQKFIGLMLSIGMTRIIVSGTCEEYGLLEGSCSESQVTDPVSQYGIQKNELRNWMESERQRIDFEFLWIRFFYLYGDNPNGRTLFQEIIQSESKGDSVFNLSTSGNQERDYLHIDTATNLASHLLVNEAITGIVNVGSGLATSLKTLVSSWKVQNQWKIDFSFNHDVEPQNEPRVQFADVSKLDELYKY